jgi:hypothetical protein
MITFVANCKAMAGRKQNCQVYAGRSKKICKEISGQDIFCPYFGTLFLSATLFIGTQITPNSLWEVNGFITNRMGKYNKNQ